jgi:predicted RNase H-like HicB family nuclease
MIKIAVVLEKCEEGGFAASVPTIPGCFSQGQTVEEAFANITEAIELHLEAVEDDLIVDKDLIVGELSWDRAKSVTTHGANGPQSESPPRNPNKPLPRGFVIDDQIDDVGGDPK